MPLASGSEFSGTYVRGLSHATFASLKTTSSVFPAKAGIQNSLNSWIPARATPDYDPGLAGMTIRFLFGIRYADGVTSASFPRCD